MEILGNLGKKASETAAKAVQKAQGMSEISRINALISEEESEIDAAYRQIGKLYVSRYGSGAEEDFLEMTTVVLELEQKIKDHREQIQVIKGVRLCEKCGAEVAKDAAFCAFCGAAIPKPVDVVRCAFCGAEIKDDDLFCFNCGRKIERP